jgi:hypothetical protein
MGAVVAVVSAVVVIGGKIPVLLLHHSAHSPLGEAALIFSSYRFHSCDQVRAVVAEGGVEYLTYHVPAQVQVGETGNSAGLYPGTDTSCPMARSAASGRASAACVRLFEVLPSLAGFAALAQRLSLGKNIQLPTKPSNPFADRRDANFGRWFSRRPAFGNHLP